MRISITSRHRPPFRKILLPCLLLWALLAGGCGERIDHSSPGETEANQPTFPHPLVERDWAQIQKSGVLRMITFYNSRTYFIHKGGP